ncbi:TPA: hypothetical protein N0F65_000021 [Lagenidium giganteum]|uniref:Uncharacterized protein n=1 Tax=Lagenidium giganteum TaxID=4803 RepID=A0AAV2YLC9_9STRA|nr:TPA: hypothetical protein N0F65_000021 [Lagenidium giganteum]
MWRPQFNTIQTCIDKSKKSLSALQQYIARMDTVDEDDGSSSEGSDSEYSSAAESVTIAD